MLTLFSCNHPCFQIVFIRKVYHKSCVCIEHSSDYSCVTIHPLFRGNTHEIHALNLSEILKMMQLTSNIANLCWASILSLLTKLSNKKIAKLAAVPIHSESSASICLNSSEFWEDNHSVKMLSQFKKISSIFILKYSAVASTFQKGIIFLQDSIKSEIALFPSLQ